MPQRMRQNAQTSQAQSQHARQSQSRTRKHLPDFTGIDPEEDWDLQEHLIREEEASEEGPDLGESMDESEPESLQEYSQDSVAFWDPFDQPFEELPFLSWSSVQWVIHKTDLTCTVFPCAQYSDMIETHEVLYRGLRYQLSNEFRQALQEYLNGFYAEEMSRLDWKDLEAIAPTKAFTAVDSDRSRHILRKLSFVWIDSRGCSPMLGFGFLTPSGFPSQKKRLAWSFRKALGSDPQIKKAFHLHLQQIPQYKSHVAWFSDYERSDWIQNQFGLSVEKTKKLFQDDSMKRLLLAFGGNL